MKETVILLDRDGTLIEERHYLHDPDGVVLLPGVAEALRRLCGAGCRLVVVSNQAGVGRGYYGLDAMHAVNARLRQLLREEGVELAGIYCCPHSPDEKCSCRKPAPGMVQQASKELGFDSTSCCVIGDKPCDVELGLNVGATAILVDTGYGADADTAVRGKAHYLAGNMEQAAAWLLSGAAERVFLRNIALHTEALKALPSLAIRMNEAAGTMIDSLKKGGKILFCGNGGSAADAQHFAAELTGRFVLERRPYAAMALHADTSALTAIANDYGFETVFERQVQALGRAGDVLVGLSTSGNSPNVLRAMQAAKDLDMQVIAMTGQHPGKSAALAHIVLNAPATVTARVQEMHGIMGHSLCEVVEMELAALKS